MFFLCVIIRAIATTTENILKITDGESKNRKRNAGNVRPAIIDETDTMPVIKRTVRKTPIQLTVRRG